MEIVYRKLSEMKKLEGNPRKITPEQLSTLKESIQRNQDYFEARPLILSDRTGELVVIAGNQRYEACKQLGIEECPTVLLEGLTEEREKEIIIRDNVSNGEWDEELLQNWDSELLEDWGVSIGEDVNPDNFGESFSLNDGDKGKFGVMNFTVTDEQRERINLALDAAVYCEGFADVDNNNRNGAGLDLIVRQWVINKMNDICKDNEEEIESKYKELRDYLRKSLNDSGCKASDVDILLGVNGMSRHYFGDSQWMFPTREAYEKMREIMDLPRDYFDCAKIVSAYNFTKKIIVAYGTL